MNRFKEVINSSVSMVLVNSRYKARDRLQATGIQDYVRFSFVFAVMVLDRSGVVYSNNLKGRGSLCPICRQVAWRRVGKC